MYFKWKNGFQNLLEQIVRKLILSMSTAHQICGFFAKMDPVTGYPIKQEYGSWFMPVLSIFTRLRILRGTVLDFFGKTPERPPEKQGILD